VAFALHNFQAVAAVIAEVTSEAVMEALIDFAAVAGAVVLSIGIALSLEWFALNTLMRMMPVQRPVLAVEEVEDASGVLSVPERRLAASPFTERKRAA